MMTGAKILVIDDHPLNAKLTQLLLSGEGYDVQTAADAESAVEILRIFRPRLILMDLQLPGMDGFELTRQLKSDPATRPIAIVALTAYAMRGDEARARDSGCDGYLSKPVDTRVLIAEVRRWITGEN